MYTPQWIRLSGSDYILDPTIRGGLRRLIIRSVSHENSQLEPLRGVFVLRMRSWYVRARNDVMCLGMHMDESTR